jgi:hypothetical protein
MFNELDDDAAYEIDNEDGEEDDEKGDSMET